MSNYYFQYDKTTNVIYPYKQDNTPATGTTMGLLGPYPEDTASIQVVMAYNYPERFLAQGNPTALVEQPYFTVTAVNNAETWAITAVLNNSPNTPPTEATITVTGQKQTAPVTNGQATLTVQVHPSISTTPIMVTAGATGCATSKPVNIGGASASQVGIQVYTPSGGTPTVAPTGVGSKAFLSAYYAMSPAAVSSLLADIGTSVNILLDVVFGVLLPSSTAALTADQQNAIGDIKANVLPKLYSTLGNIYPSGGAKQLQYADFINDLSKTYSAFGAYVSDLDMIPNLA